MSCVGMMMTICSAICAVLCSAI